MKGVIIQLLAALCISMLDFLIGLMITWPSYTLKVLQTDQSPLGAKVTSYEASLIGSLPMLGGLVSTAGAMFVTESLGRKKTEMMAGLIFALSWSIIVTARNVLTIQIGRFLSGLASGLHSINAFVYLSEYSQISIRGTVINIMAFFYTSGIVGSYIIGWVFSYDVVNYINLTLSVAYVLLVSCLKDSPVFLLRCGKDKEALKSLKFYRGTSKTIEEVLEELEYLRSQTKHLTTPSVCGDESKGNAECEKLNGTTCSENNAEGWMATWTILKTTKSMQRALITNGVMMVLIVFMGTVGIQTYAGQIFDAAAPNLSSDLCSVVLAVAVAVSSGVSMIICDFVGRRTLMISTSMMTTCCLGLLGAVLVGSWAPQWLAAVLVLFYCCIFQLGVVAVPCIQLAECFIPELKSVATSLGLCWMNISNFIVQALFISSKEHLGLGGTFFIFAGVGAATTVFSYLFMKETKGIPIEYIMEDFDRGYLYIKSK